MHFLLRGGVLRDGLGALRDGVLGKFARKEKSDGGLNLATGDGGALVVVRQTRCLSSDTLEDIVDEAVHDRHGFPRNAGVRVNLLQHLVDVDSVGFLPALLLLLVALADIFLGLAGLLGSLSSGFRSHFEQRFWYKMSRAGFELKTSTRGAYKSS